MDELKGKVQSLLGREISCACGRCHAIETRFVETGEGVIGALPAVLDRLGLAGPALVFTDVHTQAAAGLRVEQTLSGAGVAFGRRVLHPMHGDEIHAEEKMVAGVEKLIDPGTAYCVAVGSGTVSDLVKLATFHKGIPYVAVATAASMNGYTSAIAAIEVAGIKRTIECHQPLAVVGDMDVIRAAPPAMTAAGVGDLMSKPVCNADWKLSHLIRGEYYCDEPVRVVGDAADAVGRVAAEIRAGDAAALETLFNALILSGFSMKIAGSSAPASGGEHLISHYWDMRAAGRGRAVGLHGAQVGVATLVTASLYGVLQREWHALVGPASCEESMHGEHEGDAAMRTFYGPLADEVVREFRKKFPSESACRADLKSLRDHEKAIEAEVWPSLRDPGAIRQVLSRAGAPITVRELGIPPAEALEALEHAREIRGRYTVLDLAAELKVLPARAGEVLAMAKVM